MASSAPKPVAAKFAVLPKGQKLEDVTTTAKYMLVEKDDNTWEIKKITHPPGKDHINLLETMSPADPALMTQLAIIQNEVARATGSDLTTSEPNDTTNNINAQIDQFEKLTKSKDAIKDIDNGYNEIFTTEKTFKDSMVFLLNYMDTQGLAAVKNKKTRADIETFLQPFREIVKIKLMPETPSPIDTNQSPEMQAVIKVKTALDIFSEVQNNGKAKPTENAEKVFNQLGKTVVNHEEFTQLLAKNPQLAQLFLAAKKPPNMPNDLASFLIMPVQRGPRYQILANPLNDNIKKVILSDPEALKLAGNFQVQIDSVKASVTSLNERKRNFETIESRAVTQMIIGNIIDEGNAIAAKNSATTQAINNFQNDIDKINMQLISEGTQLGVKTELRSGTQIKTTVTPKDAFYAAFVTNFIPAYLAHKHSDKKDLNQALLNAFKSIDKKLEQQGLPTILFKKGDKVASSTILKSLADNTEVQNKVVEQLFNATKNILLAADSFRPAQRPQQEIAYNRVMTAMELMGPTAAKTWNNLVDTQFPEMKSQLTISEDGSFAADSFVTAAHYAEKLPRPAQSSLYEQLETPVVSPATIPEPAAVFPTHFNQGMGKISQQLSDAYNTITKMKLSEVEIETLKQYCVNMQNIIDSVLKKPPADGKFPSDKFYSATMNAYTDAFLQHQKGHVDGLNVLREMVRKIDSSLQKLTIEGILYTTAADLPGNKNKDSAALRTLAQHPDYTSARADELFSQMQRIQQSRASQKDKDSAGKKILQIVSAMDQPAIDKWNTLAMDKNLNKLVVTSPLNSQDLASATRSLSDSEVSVSNSRRQSISSTDKGSENEAELSPSPLAADIPLAPDSPPLLSSFKNRLASEPLPSAINSNVADKNEKPAVDATSSSTPSASPLEDSKVESKDENKDEAANVLSASSTVTPPATSPIDIPIAPPLVPEAPPLDSKDEKKNEAGTVLGSSSSTVIPPATSLTDIPIPPPLVPIPPPLKEESKPSPSKPAAAATFINSTMLAGALSALRKKPASPLPGDTKSDEKKEDTIPPIPKPGVSGTGIPNPPTPSRRGTILGSLTPGNDLSGIDMTPLRGPGITSTVTPTTSTITTSTVQSSGPIVPSTRDHGFVDDDKITKMNQVLVAAGWNKLSEPTQVNNENVREAKSNINGVERQFTVSHQEIKTNDADVETFKVMLQCYQKTNNVMPAITTSSEALKEKWVEAFKAVYPTRALEADRIVTISRPGLAASPTDPAPTPTPTRRM